MTSLIDVIFLLLLFFMLTSTFSKFSEVPLAAAGSGAVAQASDAKPVFLQLGPDTLRLNGDEIAHWTRWPDHPWPRPRKAPCCSSRSGRMWMRSG